jgi:hypothetical protein
MPDNRRAVVATDRRRTRTHTATRVASSGGVGFATDKGVVSSTVKEYSNDPYFVKKAEIAKEVIEKFGLPKKK